MTRKKFPLTSFPPPDISPQDIDKKSSPETEFEKFNEELHSLLNKYHIKDFGIIIKHYDREIVLLSELIVSTKLLKNAHIQCKEKVLTLIGEDLKESTKD